MPVWLILILCALALAFLIGAIGWYLRNELRGIGGLLWLSWCWLYVIRWRLRFGLRTLVGRTAAGILLAGSFYIFAEFAMVVVHLLASDESHAPPGTDQREPIGKTLALLPAIAPLPLWMELTLLVLAALVFKHHWNEWRLQRREAVVPANLTKLLRDTRAVRTLATPDEATKDDFFRQVMLWRGRTSLPDERGTRWRQSRALPSCYPA